MRSGCYMIKHLNIGMNLQEHLQGLQDLLRRNVAQFSANLQHASSQAAQICQHALSPQRGALPMLAVSTWGGGGGIARCGLAPCPAETRCFLPRRSSRLAVHGACT